MIILLNAILSMSLFYSLLELDQGSQVESPKTTGGR
jgi:hypothetical protein